MPFAIFLYTDPLCTFTMNEETTDLHIFINTCEVRGEEGVLSTRSTKLILLQEQCYTTDQGSWRREGKANAIETNKDRGKSEKRKRKMNADVSDNDTTQYLGGSRLL